MLSPIRTGFVSRAWDEASCEYKPEWGGDRGKILVKHCPELPPEMENNATVFHGSDSGNSKKNDNAGMGQHAEADIQQFGRNFKAGGGLPPNEKGV